MVKNFIHQKIYIYLGVYLDETLSGNSHCDELIKILNRANGMLAKARHFVPSKEIKNIYHAIFSSHLMYGCQIWAQNLCSVTHKISTLQSEPLFNKLEILKFKDNIVLQNCLFVYDYLKENLPNSFTNTFKRVDDTYPIITRSAVTDQLVGPSYNTTRYGLNSIYKKCIDSWNMITSEINKSKKIVGKSHLFKMYSRNELKTTLTKHLLSVYMGS